MTMTSAQANKLTANINAAFDKIGTGNGTQPPKHPGEQGKTANTDPIAYEYHVASQLERIAKKRKENAEKACIRADVLFDSEKKPRKAGTNETIYTGVDVAITLAVNNPSERLDPKIFIDELIEAGVDAELINRAKEVATKLTRAPHKFTSTLRTDG